MNGTIETDHTQRLLAIDSSTNLLAVALLENGRTIASFSSEAERNHSILLMPAIEQILSENGLAPSDLSGIAIGRGPGSYTGVRIGISVAKTMAWALGIPVISVSGLEAMSLGGWRESRLEVKGSTGEDLSADKGRSEDQSAGEGQGEDQHVGEDQGEDQSAGEGQGED
ncbi:MAG: tsaB, partial [Paenibacillus sp.]|nr:tsaB [Paenibacillus sp.]